MIFISQCKKIVCKYTGWNSRFQHSGLSARLLYCTYSVLYCTCKVGVRVDGSPGNVVLPREVLAIVDEGDDRVELLVRLAQGRLELRVRVNQALDLVEGVDDEHVDQVLPGSVQPVVEGSGALGELQVKGVDALKNLKYKNNQI